MGIAANRMNFQSRTPAPASVWGGLWRGEAGWAPPAGFVDYTPFLNRINPSLRPDRRRVAAMEGCHAEDVLRTALLALGLHREGCKLDLAGMSDILSRGEDVGKIDALFNLSDLGLLNLAVENNQLDRGFSLFSRKLSQPLPPAYPTLAHVLAHSGREVAGSEAPGLLSPLRGVAQELDQS